MGFRTQFQKFSVVERKGDQLLDSSFGAKAPWNKVGPSVGATTAKP